MPEQVRVRIKDTGDHKTITRRTFERNPDAYVELKSKATYADGTPRPAKIKTDVSSEAAKKPAASASSRSSSEG